LLPIFARSKNVCTEDLYNVKMMSIITVDDVSSYVNFQNNHSFNDLLVIIRVLLGLYLNNMMRVALNGNLLSDYFLAVNGVKQGGVLSPIIFVSLY